MGLQSPRYPYLGERECKREVWILSLIEMCKFVAANEMQVWLWQQSFVSRDEGD